MFQVYTTNTSKGFRFQMTRYCTPEMLLLLLKGRFIKYKTGIFMSSDHARLEIQRMLFGTVRSAVLSFLTSKMECPFCFFVREELMTLLLFRCGCTYRLIQVFLRLKFQTQSLNYSVRCNENDFAVVIPSVLQLHIPPSRL